LDSLRVSKSFWQVQAQAVDEQCLAAIWTHHAAKAKFACGAVGERQHNIGGADARELGENGAR
jgi:hypothetical protein